MRGDTHWTVEILLPYYTGEDRWRSIYGGESEQLARRMLAAERRAGSRARLRRWIPEVVDADDAPAADPTIIASGSPDPLCDNIPF